MGRILKGRLLAASILAGGGAGLSPAVTTPTPLPPTPVMPPPPPPPPTQPPPVVVGTGTLDPLLSRPVISVDPTSPANGSAPKFYVDSDDTLDIALGYKVVVQWRDKNGNVLGTGESGALTAAPNNSDLTISGLAALPAGTRYYRFRYERTNGSAYSAWSAPDVAVGPDDVAPLLSAPTKADIGASGATLGFTTNEPGTRYSVVVPAAEATPSNTQVKAGQRASGAAAPFVFTGAATAGVNTYLAGGLTAETAYKVVTVVEDGSVNPNLSEVLVDTFTTAVAGASSAKLVIGSGLTGADANRNRYINVAADGLTFAGNADQGASLGVRSLAAMPPKSHTEAGSLTFAGGAVWFGVVDSAVALGPTVYPRPGENASGWRAAIGSSGLTIDANGGQVAFNIGGANDGTETWAWGYDNSDPAAPKFYIKRRTSAGAVQTFGPVTLTSLIPTTPTVFVAAANSGNGGVVNFGASAFLITPETGHTGF